MTADRAARRAVIVEWLALRDGIVALNDATADMLGVEVDLLLDRLDETEGDWWTTNDVARYAGLRAGTVSSYRVRGQMPPADTFVLGRPVWRPATIREWQTRRTQPGAAGYTRSRDEEGTADG